MNISTRHIQRALQTAAAPLRESPTLPPDALEARDVRIRVAGGTGFPATADSLAYDANQSLLVVGTNNGSVKLIGALGVELTLQTPSRSATRYLAFLESRGAVVRVTQSGEIQLIGLNQFQLLASTRLEDDIITAVTPLGNEPYLLLGCQSGSVRTVALLGDCGLPAEALQPVAAVALRRYTITSQETGKAGPIVALSISSRTPGRPLLLIATKASDSPIVWDVRAQQVICSCPPADPARGTVTAACWLGVVAEGFVVGYERGAVAVFGLPAAAHAAPPGVSNPVAQAEPITVLLAPRPSLGPILSLTFILGLEELGPCMLVRGGQERGEPDMLSFLPLIKSKGGARLVPWFGNVQAHALVDQAGAVSLSAPPAAAQPDALMVLTEGGQLVIHELQTWTPMPLTLPFQELPPVTLAHVVDAPQKPASPHTLNLTALRSCGRRAVGSRDWPFKGGVPGGSRGYGAGGVLITGHRDGKVRLWDATLQVPELLLVAPAAAQMERLRPVTALEVCAHSGLLAVGHANGTVLVFQFSSVARVIRRIDLDESGVALHAHASPQPPGLQYILRYSRHSSDIQSLTLVRRPDHLTPGGPLLYVSDRAGFSSCIDLANATQRGGPPKVCCPHLESLTPVWLGQKGTPFVQHDEDIHHSSAARHPDAAADSSRNRDEEELSMSFLAVSMDGALCILDDRDGHLVVNEPVVRPKSVARLLATAVLDENGLVIEEKRRLPVDSVLGSDTNNYNGDSIVSSWAAPKELQQQNNATTSRSGGRDSENRREHLAEPSPHDSAGLQVETLPSDDDDRKRVGSGASSDDDEDAALDAALAQALKTKGGGEGAQSKGRLPFAAPLKKLAATSIGLVAERVHSVPTSPSGIADPLSPTAVPLRSGSLDDSSFNRSGVQLGQPSDSVAALMAHYGLGDDDDDDDAEVDYRHPTSPQEAVYVVVCTEEHLRLYTLSALREGSRTTARKVTFDCLATSAAVMANNDRPAVICVHADSTLLVYSLPGLVCCARSPIDPGSRMTDFVVSAADSANNAAARHVSAPSSNAAFAASTDGQLVLFSGDAEVTRLLLFQQTRQPVLPAMVYDWEVAHAAAAAGRQAEGLAAKKEEVDSAASSIATMLPFKLMDGVRETASGLAEGAARLPIFKELDRARAVGMASLQKLAVPGVRDDEPKPDIDELLPGIQDLFGAVSDAEDSDAVEPLVIGGVQPHVLDSRQPLVSSSRPRSPLPDAGPSWHATARPLASSAAAAAQPNPAGLGGSKPVNRTASQIKRAYGRTPSARDRATSTQAIMSDNMRRLADRGEKLSRLDEKTAELEEGASDFASATKQLADSFANRKWWQM